ncbi:MAG TPA: phosphoribulokinase, partial [Steroidobacteraceae bacterium]
MSAKHPIVAVTGSSGAGTTTVMRSFEHIFRRENIKAAIIEGDSFHRYDRTGMRAAMKAAEERGERNFSHFGPEANLLDELAATFKQYGETGRCRVRKYLHDAAEAARYGQDPGTFTEWTDIDSDTDMLFYEGLHGAYVDDKVNVAQ